ncbi:type II secretion system protein N [Yersinia massiliensis]|uniref:type II secretion system protein N n=1 Tax=Yersinia massiliensis TaxID=419257 RepID=UPI001E556CB0|nr:type II secretion system protein N [Yersinia massiliensis]
MGVIKMIAALALVILILSRIEHHIIPLWPSELPLVVEKTSVRHHKNDVEKHDVIDIGGLGIFPTGAEDTVKNIYRVGYLSLEDPLFLQAPLSHLPLNLVGVLSSSVHENSLAIIEQNKRQRSYIQGDELTEHNAVIVKILPDRIILNQQGYYKSLLLNEH